MTAVLAGEAFGVHARLEIGEPDLVPLVRAVLPPGWREPGGAPPDAVFTIARDHEDGGYAVLHDGEPVGRSEDREFAVEILDAKLRLHIAEHTPDWSFIHAGAVAVGGRALLLPGRSFAGKTTLVRALLERGAEYLSDEFAILDANGLVHPYPKPLSIRPDNASRRGIDTPAAHFGAVTATRALPVGLVALLRYRGAGQLTLRPLPPAEGALLMLEHAVAARTAPERVLRALQAVAASAPIVAGERGDAEEAAQRLLAAAGGGGAG